MELINFFSAISPLIASLLFSSLVFLFIIFAIFLAKLARTGKKEFGKLEKLWGLLIFSIFLSSLLAAELMEYFLFIEVNEILTKPGFEINVSGRPIEKKYTFARDFMDRRQTKFSGSSPEKVFKISISNKSEELFFELKRDSRDENLYWIFYPNYKFRAGLGYIETKVLDAV